MNNMEDKTLKTKEINFDELKESKNVITKEFAQSYTKMRLKVAAYVRVSTDFEEQQTSFHSQYVYYDGLIKQNPNWEFAGIYADEGLSGTQTKNRDSFNKMIKDALNEKIDMIITKSISRFARNTVDTLNIVRLLKSHNVDVFFEKENIHTFSVTNELFLTLYSAFAQAESESISENMKSGLQMKMKRGEYVGCPECYGYDWNKEAKTLEINTEKAKIVKRIFEEYARGYGSGRICKGLNNDKILSPTGKRWSPSTIRRLLFNEKYLGDLCTGKTFVESPVTHRKKMNQGQSKQWYTENKHEAIISKELWMKAHEMYKKRSDKSKNHRDKYSRRYAFSSKIYCGFCGERFVRRSYIKNKKDMNSERVIFWGCRSQFHEISCENKIKYKDEELKKMFVFLFNQLYSDKDKYVKQFLHYVDTVLNKDNIEKEIYSLEKERDMIVQKQSKLLDLALDNKISKQVLDSKMAELDIKHEEIKEALEKLHQHSQLKSEKIAQMNKIISIIEEKRELKEFDDDIFEALVDRIVIGKKLDDGTFDYKSIQFILKTSEIITNEDIKGLISEKINDKFSTYNESLHVTSEDKKTGLTAYRCAKRLWICHKWGKYK